MLVDRVSEVGSHDVRPPTAVASAGPFVADEGGESIAAMVTAQLAFERAVTAEVTITVAAEVASRAVSKAKQTAETALRAASEAATEVIAEAAAVAEARAVAATAAKAASERMRQVFAGVIGADVQANDLLTQRAGILAEELAARKQTEARLLEREAELAAFAGMVAHDLKGPLRAVAGFTTLLRGDLLEALPEGLATPILNKMDRILAATARMAHLVDDQLSFVTVRDRTLNVQPVDLEAMIADLVADLGNSWSDAEESRPTVEVEPIPAVRADPVMCRQLVDNLIGNALKYTAVDRPARIRISACDDPDQVPAGMVRVRIADQGIGIPSGGHEKLFVSFYRAHGEYPGTGLGLAICRRIVERHGGTITADDNSGGGSVFQFTLPSMASPAGAPLPGPRRES
jgi:signal transduction histidine kinase